MKKTRLLFARCLTLLILALLSTNLAWGEEVTMSYSGSTTGNMTGGNDAALVNLNAATWSVVGDKGGNNNFPGLNKAGQIRLYGSATNHNTITVTNLAEANITSIKVTYGASNNNAKVTVGGAEVTGTGSSDTEKTYAINSTSFTIAHNYSANTQVYISSIVITFTAGDDPQKELVSLAVSGTPDKTNYKSNEEFDPAGLTVIGTYDDASTAPITSGIEWTVTPSGALTVGTTSVSVTATINEITSSAYVVNGLTVEEFVQTYANTYTSNVELTTTGGTSATAAKVVIGGTEYDAIKAGTGSAAGAVVVTIPANTKTLHFHAAGWNGETVVLNETINLVADAGVSNNSPFTLKNDPETQDYFTLDPQGATTITFTATSGKRFVIFGVNAEESNDPSISADVEKIAFDQKELSGTVTDSKTISATGKNLTAAISASMKSGSASVFSVTPVGTPTAAAGEFTVSYSATEVGEYTGTVVLSSGETSLEIPVSASVVTHIPVLQSIAVKTAPTKTTYFVGEKFDPTGLEITATYDAGDPKDIAYFGNEDKFSFNPALDAALGTTDEKVTITYGDKTAEQAITVKTIANTQETAYTVAEAKALIDANPAELATTEVYVKGTVSNIVTEWSSQYGNITFDVSADGQTTGDQFRFYRNFKGADKTKWTSAEECPAVGDDVVGLGKLTKYGNTYEFAEGNYIVSHVKAATLEIDNIIVEMDGEISPVIETNVVDDYTISYTSDNEEVVSADGDEMTTIGFGEATITATLTAEGYKDATTTFTVEVIKALDYIEVATEPTVIDYKAGDKFDPTGLVITANYNDESTEDIAYEGNEDKFTFEPSLETELTTDITSVTITYAGKETTQEISVRALDTYDITWMANGERFTTTQVTEANALVLPETSPANVGDMEFQGWINTENYFNETTAPEYIVPDDIIPTEAMTFYAVFAKEYKGETTSVTKDIIAEAGVTASVTLNADNNPYQMGELPITLTGIKGTNNFPALNYNSKSGTDLRFYKGTTCGVTFATTNDQPITKIEFKKDATTASTLGESFSANVGTLSDNVWTGSANSITITYSSEDNFKEQMYIINVTYSEKAPSTYSNYCTTLPRSFEVSVSSSAATGLTTMYLDYATEIPEGVEAWYVSGYNADNDCLTMAQINDYVPANTGIIVKGTAGKSYNFVETYEDVDAIPGNMLTGSVTDYEVADYDVNDGWYYLALSGNFKKYEGQSIVRNAHKAYLYLIARPWSTSAKELTIDWGKPTGIESHQSSTLNPQPSQYNLQGVRVNPSLRQVQGKLYSGQAYKGVVIMNGKKYLNK